VDRKTHHVVHNPNGGWNVKKGGASRASKSFQNQTDAIDYAKSVAKKNRSELFIHRRDGTIRKRSNYGNDPYPPWD
jgi:hypothetical protein